MSVIDEVLAANKIYSRTHDLRKLTPCPERKLAVLTCMDTRLSIRTLGLKTGDAHIIRNAGGIVTDDSLRSLVVSHYLLGTEGFMVINHTDCGLMQPTGEGLRTRIQNRSGTGGRGRAAGVGGGGVAFGVDVAALGGHEGVGEAVAEFSDFFATHGFAFGLGDFFQFTFIDNVDGAFGAHYGNFGGGPGEIGVGADVLGGHDAIGATVGLAGDDGDFRHSGFSESEE